MPYCAQQGPPFSFQDVFFVLPLACAGHSPGRRFQDVPRHLVELAAFGCSLLKNMDRSTMVNEIVLLRVADGGEVVVTKGVDIAIRDAGGVGVLPSLAALNMGSGNRRL